jgi:hypothetical protein
MAAGPDNPEKEAELAARHDRIRAEVAADETSDARRGRRLRELGSLLSILVLAAINWLWFDLVGSDYLEWFVDNGTLIALAFALVSVAVDLNRHSGLIAATPSGFVAAILGVFAELGESLGSLFAKPRADVDLWDSGLATLTSRYRSKALDTVFGGIFLGLFFVVMAGWLFVVAPLQYFLNLPCGAPARMALTSERTIWVVNSPGRY